LFFVVFLFPVGLCFLKPRVCLLLFSSSIVIVITCLNYCLDLLFGWLGFAPPLGSRPSPRRPLPFLSSNPTSVRVVGGPLGWAWSSNTPLPNRAGTPPRLALGLPTPQRASPVGPPFDGTHWVISHPLLLPLSTCNFSASSP